MGIREGELSLVSSWSRKLAICTIISNCRKVVNFRPLRRLSLVEVVAKAEQNQISPQLLETTLTQLAKVEALLIELKQLEAAAEQASAGTPPRGG